MVQKKSKHIVLPADKQIKSKKIPPGQLSETQELIHKLRVHQIQLEKTVSLLRGTLDSTADGILVVNNAGKIESFNQRFIELWGIPESIIASRDDNRALTFVLDQLKTPDEFLTKVRELYSDPDAESFDVLEFKDGRFFERYSRPQKIGEKSVGRVWSFRDITKHKRAEEALKQSFEKVKKVLGGTVYALAEMSQRRDPYTGSHQRRVSQLSCAIAHQMGLPENQIEGVRMAALLHDIGKMYVPSEILTKPGQISDLETGIIETHAQVGYEILQTIEFPWPVAKTVLQHQERLNGSGYPAGLSGEEILLEARILAVADVVEAMSSHRPYRATLGLKKALNEISQNRGILYDPNVVDACLILFTDKTFEFE
jgi:putative nucleotidyltransferase with HDIG domain/PAS domain S-box-containing protein